MSFITWRFAVATVALSCLCSLPLAKCQGFYRLQPVPAAAGTVPQDTPWVDSRRTAHSVEENILESATRTEIAVATHPVGTAQNVPSNEQSYESHSENGDTTQLSFCAFAFI